MTVRAESSTQSSTNATFPTQPLVMSSKPTTTVTVQRRFAASDERVFDAWLDPTMIGQWMFGPSLREEEIVRLSVDAQVGGRFSFLVRRQGQEIDHVGKYLEIDRPRRLVFTWGIAGLSVDETDVTVDIEPLEVGCELTLTHRKVWSDYAERTKAGWATMVDVLAKVLAPN